MFDNSTKIGRVMGIDIKLHFSWWLVFLLLAWSLASSYFPQILSGQSLFVYGLMGLGASLLLFISVLLHELSHSFVAKIRKMKVESITLFFFGGVAGISDEDVSPQTELMMALAGPLFSFLLSGLFYLFYTLNGNPFLGAVTFYLSQINLSLAIFNLLPGFPLDGGRAFRAVLYWYFKSLRKATYIATMGGKILAGFMIIVGLAGVVVGQGPGFWFIFLGFFLYLLAKVSYEQVLLKEALRPIPIINLVRKKFEVLNAQMSFADFLKKYSIVEEEAFMVRDAKFKGVFDLQRLENLAKIKVEDKSQMKLQSLSLSLEKIGHLDSKDNAYTAFKKFNQLNIGLILVH